VGLVSNSNLILVREGVNFKVYDINGSLQTTFPGGDMYFCHDRYDFVDGKWYAVFARSLTSWNNDSIKAKVDVFEWPSDRLGELGG